MLARLADLLISLGVILNLLDAYHAAQNHVFFDAWFSLGIASGCLIWYATLEYVEIRERNTDGRAENAGGKQ